MKLFILFILFSLSTTATAQEVSISYSKTNDLILTSKSCNELVTEFSALCRWKNQIEPEFSLPVINPSQCKKLNNGKYTLSIPSCLPNFVRENHHKKMVHSGANCWGTALSLKKLTPKPRFVWPEEIQYWMSSPICRKLDIDEKLQEGDIINVYGPEYIFEEASPHDKGHLFWKALFPGRLKPTVKGESGYSGYHNFLHSETYLTKNISFGKDSPSHEDRFDFHPLKEVYGRSRLTECQENQSLEPHAREYQNSPRPIKGSDCDYFTNAYRCGNIADYFKDQTLTDIEISLLNEITAIQSTQDRLFKLMFGKLNLSKLEVKQILELADLKAAEAQERLQEKLSKNEEMLLTLKYFSASGLRKSLEQAELTPATEPL